jgi:hypothetical protein
MFVFSIYSANSLVEEFKIILIADVSKVIGQLFYINNTKRPISVLRVLNIRRRTRSPLYNSTSLARLEVTETILTIKVIKRNISFRYADQ